MSGELLLVLQQEAHRCGVGCVISLWSSKGLGFGFAAGLGVSCFIDVGKPLDSLSPPCGNKTLMGGQSP